MAPLPVPFPGGVIFRTVPEKTFRALDAADGVRDRPGGSILPGTRRGLRAGKHLLDSALFMSYEPRLKAHGLGILHKLIYNKQY